MAGNLAVVALYAVTRTVGIPLFGPQAGEVEAVGAVDLATLGAELALVACLARLVAGERTKAAASP